MGKRISDKERMDWITRKRLDLIFCGLKCWHIGEQSDTAHKTPRKAIDAAIRQEKKERGV